MIGQRLKAKGSKAAFDVVGQGPDSTWIVVPAGGDASPEALTVAEILKRFGVKASRPGEADEAEGWQNLAAANADNALAQLERRPVTGRLPEEVFREANERAASE